MAAIVRIMQPKQPEPYPCHCDTLDDAVDDANSSIVFDEMTNEYHLESRDGRGHHIIRYCPFCGGHTPASRRQRLFARPSPAELQRLKELTKDIRTIEDALRILGTPGWDNPQGTTWSKPATDDNPPLTTVHRTLWYYDYSDTADVCVTEFGSAGATVSFPHKALKPDALPPAEPPMRARDLRAEQGKREEPKETLYCVMCGKSDREAAKMVANVNANICDECVSDCVEALNSV
jgi:ClpX C4-type zinc finger protein/uncharacterized protein DUF6980